MSATTIAAIVVGLIITALLLVWVNQWRQRNNDAKRRGAISLANQVKRYDALLHSIPATCIDPKIQLLLLQAGKNALQKLMQWEPAPRHEAKLQELTDLAQQISSGKSFAPAIDLSNAKAGQELRHDLKTLFSFISEQAKKGNLDKKFAKQQLVKTQFYRAESLANAHLNQAMAAGQTGKFRVAIHHLHDAIAAFAKIPNNSVAVDNIAAYRQRIVQLEKFANQQSMAKTGTANPATDSNLSSELDQLNSAEAKWKKKQDYQD